MIKMKLNNNPFNLIKNGEKIIELRLFDSKRKSLQIGDIIEFTNISNGQKIQTKINALLN